MTRSTWPDVLASCPPERVPDLDLFIDALRTGDRQAHEALEARGVIEPPAAALASTRITTQGVDALLAVCAAHECAASPEERIALDEEFHTLLAGSTGNQRLVRTLASLNAPLRPTRLLRGVCRASADFDAAREHRAIVAAVAEGDAEFASALVVTHIAGVDRWLRDLTAFALGTVGSGPGRDRR